MVITTATASRRGDADTIESVDIQGTCDLIDAARLRGVARFIYMSAYGASIDHAAPILAAKAYAEAYLRGSGLAHAIFAPNLFMDVWVERVVAEPVRAGRDVILIGKGLRRHSMVAADDVAEITARVVDAGAGAGEHIPIGGPAAISWRDVLAAYERACGRSIGCERDSTIAGMPEPQLQLLRSLELFDSPIDMSAVIARFGLTLTAINDYAARSVTGSTAGK